MKLGRVSIYETFLSVLNLTAGRKQMQIYFKTEISHYCQCCTLMPYYSILLSYYI